ncbi:hypothetical protein J1614_012181 [Plenodomus biglobosus]|nr:hypothetical protein J1614_012181 [Plenodomus biglobosus]
MRFFVICAALLGVAMAIPSVQNENGQVLAIEKRQGLRAAVRDMADKLPAARGAGQVRQNWLANFFRRTGSLTTRFNRAPVMVKYSFWGYWGPLGL